MSYGPDVPESSGGRPDTSIASSRGRTRPSCRCSSRPSSSCRQPKGRGRARPHSVANPALTRRRGDRIAAIACGCIRILALAGAGGSRPAKADRAACNLAWASKRGLAVHNSMSVKLVGVEDALVDLELLAAGVLSGFLRSALEGPREFSAFARCGGDRTTSRTGHIYSPCAGFRSRS